MLYALGFSHWKRKPLRACFPDQQVAFVSSLEKVPADATVVVWGMRKLPEAGPRRLSVIRVEDGFLRSVGLGADLIRPVSWVVDHQGMYFDAIQPSDLETLLAETEFSEAMRSRAAALRERVVEEGFTKYNLGGPSWYPPPRCGRIILVPGQVESDASLKFGASGVKTNLGLLQAVRKSNPDAYVVYKPHPDVVARLRAKGLLEEAAQDWCDEIVTDAPMGELLDHVDEVHVMTSLAGFEALIRKKKVTCYGQPFFSGWGLTSDILPVSRRTRRLSLDELVCGTLILYPSYMSRRGNRLISPEEALNELLAWRKKAGRRTPWWRELFRFVLRRVVGVR